MGRHVLPSSLGRDEIVALLRNCVCFLNDKLMIGTSCWSVCVSGRCVFHKEYATRNLLIPFSRGDSFSTRNGDMFDWCFFNSQTSGVQKSKSSSITLSLFLTHPKNHQLQCFTLTAATPPLQNSHFNGRLWNDDTIIQTNNPIILLFLLLL